MRKNKILFFLVGITIFSLFIIPAMAIPSGSIKNIELRREEINAFDKFASDSLGLFDDTNSLVPVIIETATADYDLVTQLVNSLDGTVNIKYKNIYGFSINIPANNLFALAQSPLISKIYKDEIRELNILKEEINVHSLTTDASIAVAPVNYEMTEFSPSVFSNSYLTDAELVWGETDGTDVSVAVIDTGCWSDPWVDPDYGITWYPWYWDAVYDGVDLSYDVGTEFEGYGNPANHYHGTACATLIAAAVEIIFSPDHIWGEAILRWDNEGTWVDDDGYIHTICFGIAPGVDIFAVKVFDHTGGGVPSSVIMQGIDAAITEGVDVISMSLGGGVGAPGADPEDLLVDAATEAGITVVASAGNEGPAPLKVGSPGTAKTSITVGAASDPMHDRVAGDILLWYNYGLEGYGYYYYPNDELYVADFSCRGPTSDGRSKPDVVATGSWTFFSAAPSDWPSTIRLGGGTSFSCPQVAGEAALLIGYDKLDDDIDFTPSEIKQAIKEGAIPIDGFEEFEQGTGYINCYNSLEILKAMEEEKQCHRHCKCHCGWNWNHHCGSWWFPPLEMLDFHHDVAKVYDITLEPGKFHYFNFWVSEEVDSIRITLSDIQNGEVQNPLFGDAGVLYLANAPREGIDDYPFWGSFFWEDGTDWIFEISSDVHFQPGVMRLVLAGDFSSYNPTYVGEMTVEIVKTQAFKFGRYLGIMNCGVDVEEAQVELFKGDIIKEHGRLKEGEYELYGFTFPDLGHDQLAILELSWYRDWTKWATTDLDILVYQLFPDGYYYLVNVDGATGASPEFVQLTEPGEYLIMIDGYQVYFDKSECYSFEITYFRNLMGNWQSKVFTLDSWFTFIKLPRRKKGLAVLWLHSVTPYWDYWYIGDIVKL